MSIWHKKILIQGVCLGTSLELLFTLKQATNRLSREVEV